MTSITYNSTPADALLATSPHIITIQANFADPAAAQAVITKAINRLGSIDVVVNNAGAIKTDAADTGPNYAVNVAAHMALLTAALPHLNAGASIINISSINATLPAMGATFYSASKAALNTWIRAMAKP